MGCTANSALLLINISSISQVRLGLNFLEISEGWMAEKEASAVCHTKLPIAYKSNSRKFLLEKR